MALSKKKIKFLKINLGKFWECCGIPTNKNIHVILVHFYFETSFIYPLSSQTAILFTSIWIEFIKLPFFLLLSECIKIVVCESKILSWNHGCVVWLHTKSLNKENFMCTAISSKHCIFCSYAGIFCLLIGLYSCSDNKGEKTVHTSMCRINVDKFPSSHAHTYNSSTNPQATQPFNPSNLKHMRVGWKVHRLTMMHWSNLTKWGLFF